MALQQWSILLLVAVACALALVVCADSDDGVDADMYGARLLNMAPYRFGKRSRQCSLHRWLISARAHLLALLLQRRWVCRWRSTWRTAGAPTAASSTS